jgi:PAS domain S-box-containing protein
MQKWILAGFCLVLLILVANGLLAYHNLHTLMENDRWVTHTQGVQREIEGLLTDLRDMGTGQGGYLLTGDEIYLSAFDVSKERVAERTEHLRKLTADNRQQQARLDQLQPLIAARIETLQGLIETRRKEGFEAARDALFRPETLGQMRDIRDIIGTMAQDEDRLLALRTKQSQTSFRRLAMVFSVATLLAACSIAGVFAIYRLDLADRARADAARAQLAAIVSSAQDAIISKDLSGTITSWNAGAERLYGYSPREAIGQNITLIVPPHLNDEEGRILDAMRRGNRVEQLETERRHKSGRIIPVSLTISPVRDANGAVVGVSKIARDITERKRAEQSLREARDQLEERVIERTAELEAANKELEAFSYTVSHDLRAPLRAIDGFSRILLDEFTSSLPPECQEYLRDVRANTQQMGRLVDDLLAFSRLSRQPIKRQMMEMTDVVQQSLDEFRVELQRRQAEIRLGELPPCSGDPALIKQVWTNLLSNALKYTAQRPQATIEIGSLDGADAAEPTYFVKDNGVGFDMKYAHKLFGVFQRLHRAEEYEGTGVGLAIVQRIVHRHGGRVWADAKPNEGATFFFTLSCFETSDA